MINAYHLINIVLAYVSFSILMVPFRLVGVFNPAIVDSYIYFLIGSLFLYKVLFYSHFRANLFLWVLMFFPFVLVPLGLINGNSLVYVVSDALKPLIFFSIVIYLKNVEFSTEEFYKKTYFFNNVLFVCSFVAICSVLFLYFLGFNVRPSVSDLSMYFTFSIILFSGHYLKSFIFGCLLILGGKIGPLLGFLCSFILYKFRHVGFVRPLVFLFLFLLPFSLVPTSFYESYLPLYGKVSYLFSVDFDMNDMLLVDDKLLGGRLAEIVSAMASYLNNYYMWFFGYGVGYEYEYYRAGVFEGLLHGVHFSPVSLLTIYGFFYTFLFFVFVLKVIFECFKHFKSDSDFVLVAISIFFITAFLNSFTSYSIFSVLLFPVSAGIILNKGAFKCVE
ncbi:hypothetical protein [Rheinheimera faecalis]|uniref:hypothetical protein n=1 Tax=Rheinheimera faecalis TaxID=2901141 RepID=UPI001E47D1EA|nr:hypothetical protein [Rheinheimera faecalis]